MSAEVNADGTLINEDCPIHRIRIMSKAYKGRLLVSVNGREWRISQEQYNKLEDLMRSWD